MSVDDECIRFIRFGFERTFVQSPVADVAQVEPFFRSVKEALVIDLRAKYPKRTDSTLPDDFFTLVQLDAGLEATVLYRIEHAMFVVDPNHSLLPWLANLMRLRTGTELYYSTSIGPGLNVQHGSGIVIGPHNRIGKGFIVHHGVTMGQRQVHAPSNGATLGDDVVLYAGSAIVGPVIVGDRVHLAANAVLTTNAESDSIYAGMPAKRVAPLPTK